MIHSAASLRVTIISGVILLFGGVTHAEKIRTAIPQANLNYLSIYVVDAKGFLKPGLPTPEAIKNFLECDIKIPLQIKEDIPAERLLNLQFVEEVKKELEAAQRRLPR
jgi:hypothetical protein